MKVTVRVARSFKIAVKPLLKRYQSLTKDLIDLERELKETPRLGTPLGQDAYKIRLKISSKAKERAEVPGLFRWLKPKWLLLLRQFRKMK